ncbi:unnamed protein product [Orchesella dallaii]|uniref:Uncharacterized protein n=1 Tax=Orchesella dallaii TaxID=48710 RepID=A0ABP1RUR8_9HEXA
MSKTERGKLVQPIPLSSILDPSHQTPFSKLAQFQFDLDLSKVHMHHPEVQRPSLWRKMQTTLINAMSNLVVISQPVFSTSIGKSTANSATTMSLVHWKPTKSCELLEMINLTDSSESSSSSLSPPKHDNNYHYYHPQSLYHSVRSGLECLRYFATHPLQEEKVKDGHICKQNISSFDYTDYADYSREVSLTPNSGCLGAVFFPAAFPFFIATEQFYQQSSWSSATSQVPAPNLFSLAMSGFLLPSPPYLNLFYENSCPFSPIHKFKGSIPSHEPPGLMDAAKSEFEMIVHATSHQTTQESGKGPGSPVKSDTSANMASSSASPKATGMGEGMGCIRVANWRGRNNNDDDRPFQSVSVCSSSTSKGGTVTFCSSATVTSSSPRAVAIGCPRSAPRRIRTESESSVDSFVEFSASVESTDSFCIVFESAGTCIDEEYLLEFERDDDQWEDEDDEDDSEDEEDHIFDYACEADAEIFQADIDDGNECIVLPERQHDQTDSASCGTKKHKAKSVSFDEEKLVSVIEFEDNAESRRARETYWEVFARDRARFQDRILRTGDIIEPILSVSHRARVYSSRLAEPHN